MSNLFKFLLLPAMEAIFYRFYQFTAAE